MSDLVKRLRIKAGMIEMGEKIAWGSDSALMREAADALDAAAPDHIAGARKMVAAAAQGVGSGPLPANRYGVDCDYFTKKLEILIRDMGNYTPAELARSLGRLAMTANSETMREPEFNTAPAVQGEPVAKVAEEVFGSDGTSDFISARLPVGTKLYAAPQPAEQQPDATQLVGALTELCDEIDKHEIHAVISKTSISWFKRKARAVLAAHRKQGGDV